MAATDSLELVNPYGFQTETVPSIRSMAKEAGLSHTSIRRIWAAFGLQPHREERFKLSSDPLIVDKVHDIVGLYLSRPNRAVDILCPRFCGSVIDVSTFISI